MLSPSGSLHELLPELLPPGSAGEFEASGRRRGIAAAARAIGSATARRLMRRAATGRGRGRPAAPKRTRRHNQAFMNEQLARILGAKNHLLRFLVDPKTRRWVSRSHLSQEPTVQAGHLVSFHSGATERLAIEDALFNQLSNWKGERQGAVFDKPAVSIGGVPVELRTARTWENTGMLPKGTVARSPRHPGWAAK